MIFPCNDIHWHKVFLHTKYIENIGYLLYSRRSFNINITLANYCMNYFLVVLTLEDITSLWILWIMFSFLVTCLVAPKFKWSSCRLDVATIILKSFDGLEFFRLSSSMDSFVSSSTIALICLFLCSSLTFASTSSFLMFVFCYLHLLN